MIRLKNLLLEQGWIQFIAAEVGEEVAGITVVDITPGTTSSRLNPKQQAAIEAKEVQKNLPAFAKKLNELGFSQKNVQSTEADWETAASGVYQVKLGLGSTGISPYKIIIQHPGVLNQAGTFKVWVWHKNGLKNMFASIRSLFSNNDATLQRDGTCTFIIRRNDLINTSIAKTKENLSALVSLVSK
jgi:hypothetical protein